MVRPNLRMAIFVSMMPKNVKEKILANSCKTKTQKYDGVKEYVLK